MVSELSSSLLAQAILGQGVPGSIPCPVELNLNRSLQVLQKYDCSKIGHWSQELVRGSGPNCAQAELAN